MSTPYTVRETRNYDSSTEALFQAALGAIGGLEGKVLKQDAGASIEAQFDKKILGKVLGDRTRANVQIGAGETGSAMTVEIYPLDAVGRPLMFGARKGVTQTVLGWFFAHLEHRLAGNS